MSHYKNVTQCRVCNSKKEFTPILNLGSQYLANAFHPQDSPPTVTAPINLVRCPDCTTVQLAHEINPDLMYRTYWYKSGINTTMQDHLKKLAEQVQQLVNLRGGDIIMDIGCNDGTLFRYFEPNIVKIGVDPSNIPTSNCDIFINDYFSAQLVDKKLLGKKAKLITSIAMFYDINDPCSFVRDIKSCLSDDGIWVAELCYLPFIIERVQYDTICHEHVAYYRIETFNRVLRGSGLELFDVDFNNTNGGTIRVYVAPTGMRTPTARLQEALKKEQTGGYGTDKPYVAFAKAVQNSREQLISFLMSSKAQNKKVYGYGASTKGQVMMQYCEITSDLITAIAERNPLKFGLYTPGTDVRICAEDEMRSAMPDYMVIFPYFFLQEFLIRERELLEKNCKFVVPIPKFEVIAK